MAVFHGKLSRVGIRQTRVALHCNFDTIAVRVHFGASGCIRVQFALGLKYSTYFVLSMLFNSIQLAFNTQSSDYLAEQNQEFYDSFTIILWNFLDTW